MKHVFHVSAELQCSVTKSSPGGLRNDTQTFVLLQVQTAQVKYFWRNWDAEPDVAAVFKASFYSCTRSLPSKKDVTMNSINSDGHAEHRAELLSWQQQTQGGKNVILHTALEGSIISRAILDFAIIRLRQKDFFWLWALAMTLKANRGGVRGAGVDHVKSRKAPWPISSYLFRRSRGDIAARCHRKRLDRK